jgi:hypothetical protein
MDVEMCNLIICICKAVRVGVLINGISGRTDLTTTSTGSRQRALNQWRPRNRLPKVELKINLLINGLIQMLIV